MLQILCEGPPGHAKNDHGPRGKLLAQVHGGSCGYIETAIATPKPGLVTLVLWGHGDAEKLCGMKAADAAEVVKRWKAINPGIKTLEIITCNARHASGSGSPYVSQLKSKLTGFRSSTRDIEIKALPVAVGGKRNNWSILLAEPVFKSWVYITAPGANDALLMQAKTLIDYEAGERGEGLQSYRGDIAIKADQSVRAAPMNRQWTMNYGYFNTLRSHLVKV
jgi:hypothetical protein